MTGPASPAPHPARLLRHPAGWLALGLGSGLAPWAPGTAASALAVLLWAAILEFAQPAWPAQLALFLALLVTATAACGWAGRRLRRKDPGCIVADEFAGQWLVLLTASGPGWPPSSCSGVRYHQTVADAFGIPVASATRRSGGLWAALPIGRARGGRCHDPDHNGGDNPALTRRAAMSVAIPSSAPPCAAGAGLMAALLGACAASATAPATWPPMATPPDRTGNQCLHGRVLGYDYYRHEDPEIGRNAGGPDQRGPRTRSAQPAGRCRRYHPGQRPADCESRCSRPPATAAWPSTRP